MDASNDEGLVFFGNDLITNVVKFDQPKIANRLVTHASFMVQMPSLNSFPLEALAYDGSAKLY
jgi:hypothetical protein